MNDRQTTERIRRMLDESAEHVPYRVVHRLENARQAALARASALAEPEFAGQTGARGQVSLEEPSLRRRSRAAAILSLMLLLAGLVALSVWTDLQEADENADVEMAVLTDDDVPIAGYADRGFGVFLKNARP